MGRIIHQNNGKTTIFTSGEDISSITPSTDNYYVGIDLNSGVYEKLNPDGNIINLEPINKTIENISPAAVINITTQSSEHYVMLGEVDCTLFPDGIEFNLTNPGTQTLGDKLYVVSQLSNVPTQFPAYAYCYNTNDFYIAECGESDGNCVYFYTQPFLTRDITAFIYDGEKYCSTFDNC